MVLQERPVHQIRGEPRRRWFSDEQIDLFLFYDGREISGFQLCYDTRGRERALIWDRAEGIRHLHVDSGEREPFEHRSPVIEGRAGGIPSEWLRRVAQALETVPDDVRDCLQRVLQYNEPDPAG